MSLQVLTEKQTHALFDLLTHYETYVEIEAFKTPHAVNNYGYPITTSKGQGNGSSSPLLQTLLTKFVLPLPGVGDLPQDFWSVRVQGLLVRLGEAELSESYDKGALGTRKTLATGASGVIEMVGRGALGGVRRKQKKKKTNEEKDTDRYDRTKAADLARAWDAIVEGLVYGDLVEDMFDHVSKTDDLEGHSPAVMAAAEYAIIQ